MQSSEAGESVDLGRSVKAAAPRCTSLFLLLPAQRWQPWDREERRHQFRSFVTKRH